MQSSMKSLLPLFVVVAIGTVTLGASPLEFQGMADQIAEKLREDIKGNKLRDVFWSEKYTVNGRGRPFSEVQVNIISVTGLDNVALTVNDWGMARSEHGPAWIEGTLTAGLVKVGGKATFSVSGPRNISEDFEMKHILKPGNDRLGYKFKILIDDHGKGKIKVENFREILDNISYSWRLTMTSCDVDNDILCAQLANFFTTNILTFDTKSIISDKVIGDKLKSLIQGYQLDIVVDNEYTIVDRVRKGLQSDSREERLVLNSTKTYTNKKVGDRMYKSVVVQLKSIAGLENVTMNIQSSNLADPTWGSQPKYFTGYIRGGPVAIRGSVTYTIKDGEEGTEDFVVQQEYNPKQWELSCEYKIVVSKVKELNTFTPRWGSNTVDKWTRKMTSCQVDGDNICSDLLLFTYHVNGRDNFTPLIDEPLKSAVKRYLKG